MKQKIKKLAYTIPLDSDYIHDANIVVAKINVKDQADKCRYNRLLPNCIKAVLLDGEKNWLLYSASLDLAVLTDKFQFKVSDHTESIAVQKTAAPWHQQN